PSGLRWLLAALRSCAHPPLLEIDIIRDGRAQAASPQRRLLRQILTARASPAHERQRQQKSSLVRAHDGAGDAAVAKIVVALERHADPTHPGVRGVYRAA